MESSTNNQNSLRSKNNITENESSTSKGSHSEPPPAPKTGFASEEKGIHDVGVSEDERFSIGKRSTMDPHLKENRTSKENRASIDSKRSYLEEKRFLKKARASPNGKRSYLEERRASKESRVSSTGRRSYLEEDQPLKRPSLERTSFSKGEVMLPNINPFSANKEHSSLSKNQSFSDKRSSLTEGGTPSLENRFSVDNKLSHSEEKRFLLDEERSILKEKRTSSDIKHLQEKENHALFEEGGSITQEHLFPGSKLTKSEENHMPLKGELRMTEEKILYSERRLLEENPSEVLDSLATTKEEFEETNHSYTGKYVKNATEPAKVNVQEKNPLRGFMDHVEEKEDSTLADLENEEKFDITIAALREDHTDQRLEIDAKDIGYADSLVIRHSSITERKQKQDYLYPIKDELLDDWPHTSTHKHLYHRKGVSAYQNNNYIRAKLNYLSQQTSSTFHMRKSYTELDHVITPPPSPDYEHMVEMRGPTVRLHQHQEGKKENELLAIHLHETAAKAMLELLEIYKPLRISGKVDEKKAQETSAEVEDRLKKLEREIKQTERRVAESRREQAYTLNQINELEMKLLRNEEQKFIKSIMYKIPNSKDLDKIQSLKDVMMERRKVENNTKKLKTELSAMNKVIANTDIILGETAIVRKPRKVVIHTGLTPSSQLFVVDIPDGKTEGSLVESDAVSAPSSNSQVSTPKESTDASPLATKMENDDSKETI